MEQNTFTTHPATTELTNRFNLDERTLRGLNDRFEIARWHFMDAEQFIASFKDNRHNVSGLFDFVAGEGYEKWKPGIKEALTAWYETMMADNFPEVAPGTPATIHYYSDHRAATVTAVEFFKGKKLYGHPVPRKITLAHNNTECLDWYANQYKILDTIDDRAEVYTFRKGGRWYGEGCPAKWGEVTVSLGYRYHSIDPSF